MKKNVVYILLISACSLMVLAMIIAYEFLPPRIIHYSPPNLYVSYDAFEKLGCKIDSNNLVYSCPQDTPWSKKLGDIKVKKVSNLLGGLSPRMQIVECVGMGYPPSYTALIRIQENMQGICYVVYDGKEFSVVTTEDELRRIFSPIETKEEALSYVLATKYLEARYSIKKNFFINEYLVDTIEETHVEKIDDEYIMNLFYYQIIGCGPRYTYSVDVEINSLGEIEAQWDIISRETLFPDLCTD